MLRHHRFAIVAVWTLAATLLLANNAPAYIGPGAGLEFVTYAMSLLAMAGIAFFSVLMWPLYTVIRWIRGSKAVPPPALPPLDAPVATTPATEPAVAPPQSPSVPS